MLNHRFSSSSLSSAYTFSLILTYALSMFVLLSLCSRNRSLNTCYVMFVDYIQCPDLFTKAFHSCFNCLYLWQRFQWTCNEFDTTINQSCKTAPPDSTRLLLGLDSWITFWFNFHIYDLKLPPFNLTIQCECIANLWIL